MEAEESLPDHRIWRTRVLRGGKSRRAAARMGKLTFTVVVVFRELVETLACPNAEESSSFRFLRDD